MSNSDFSLYDASMLLSANKSSEFQSQIIMISDVLMRFFKRNNLLVDLEPFEEDGKVRRDLIVKKSNVTEDGFELFKKVIPGWSSYIDRGGKIENISRLEKGLAKIRENKSQTN